MIARADLHRDESGRVVLTADGWVELTIHGEPHPDRGTDAETEDTPRWATETVSADDLAEAIATLARDRLDSGFVPTHDLTVDGVRVAVMAVDGDEGQILYQAEEWAAGDMAVYEIDADGMVRQWGRPVSFELTPRQAVTV